MANDWNLYFRNKLNFRCLTGFLIRCWYLPWEITYQFWPTHLLIFKFIKYTKCPLDKFGQNYQGFSYVSTQET